MYSKVALKLYGAVRQGTIKSNAMFWRDFSFKEKIEELDIDTKTYQKELEEKEINLISCFDDGFIELSSNLKKSEKPFLFVYKGDIKLLTDKNNIAIIGVLTPSKEIAKREENIARELVKNNLNIVSGLAKGCDTIAHKTCILGGGKTIAILPTTFDEIYPAENKKLVDEIVKSGGLVITEYINEPANKYERIKRFIERDRLQAMISKAVILIASFRQGEGDSGSRHAMQKAEEYEKLRFVMFNEKTDKGKSIFGLNEDLINVGVSVLCENSIKEMAEIK